MVSVGKATATIRINEHQQRQLAYGLTLTSLFGAEGISDRCPKAPDVARTEFEVVVNDIEVGLGTDEEVAPEVITDAAAKVDEKMIAADVGQAA